MNIHSYRYIIHNCFFPNSSLCSFQTVAKDHVLTSSFLGFNFVFILIFTQNLNNKKCQIKKLRRETDNRTRKNNSIETVSHVILTDRNTRNAKIIQATPQNSHIIIKLFFLSTFFLLSGWIRKFNNLTMKSFSWKKFNIKSVSSKAFIYCPSMVSFILDPYQKKILFLLRLLLAEMI